MSWFKRLRSFVEEEDILAEDFEAEFDGIADALNGLFAAKEVRASKNLTLTNKGQDIPGTEDTVVAAVPSLLIVTVSVDMQVYIEFSEAFAKNYAEAVLNVDGVDRSAVMDVGGEGEELKSGGTGVSGIALVQASVGQSYVVKLDAGAHTIKLRAWEGDVLGALMPAGTVWAAPTGYTYLLIPNPEP